MAETSIPTVPDSAPPEIKGYLQSLRNEVIRLSEISAATVVRNKTLEELLGGIAAVQVGRGDGTLGYVQGIKTEPFEAYIAFYVTQNYGYRLELWRGIGPGATSGSSQRVMITDNLSLEDTPPAGETYRYWLRYVSQDGSEFGAFTPKEGIPFTSTAPTDPESVLGSAGIGNVFLETFEDEDFHSEWVEKDGANTPVITYPHSGTVGGKVASVAGDEAWRVAPSFYPYDPNQMYRMQVGVRLSAIPSNPAKSKVRFGFECLDSNQAILDTGGGSSYLNAHWFCAFDIDLNAIATGLYQTFIGYMSGVGSSPTNNAKNVVFPSVARTNTKYWRPVVVVNYDDGNGTTEIDYIRVDVLNPLDATFSQDTFVATGNCVISGQSVTKVGGASAFDSQVYSLKGYQTCHVQFKRNETTTTVIVGLNTDPLADPSSSSIDYGWYTSVAGGLAIFESAVNVGTFGTYTTSTVLAITYDGTNVVYLKDNVAVRTVAVGGLVLYADSSFYDPGVGVNSLQFGPTATIRITDTPQIKDNAATEFGSAASASGSFTSNTYAGPPTTDDRTIVTLSYTNNTAVAQTIEIFVTCRYTISGAGGGWVVRPCFTGTYAQGTTVGRTAATDEMYTYTIQQSIGAGATATMNLVSRYTTAGAGTNTQVLAYTDASLKYNILKK